MQLGKLWRDPVVSGLMVAGIVGALGAWNLDTLVKWASAATGWLSTAISVPHWLLVISGVFHAILLFVIVRFLTAYLKTEREPDFVRKFDSGVFRELLWTWEWKVSRGKYFPTNLSGLCPKCFYDIPPSTNQEGAFETMEMLHHLTCPSCNFQATVRTPLGKPPQQVILADIAQAVRTGAWKNMRRPRA
ncbi:hypothetical protein [Pandoraea sputorum]|uniref:hypothetical protein n=1 Tax=Pandoraea sputorum TaxID=93222 RepID=UPI00057F4F08|nr:hypothetical protein [Pandoraea sputorum]AJC15130.1 hypothetical protein NA29_02055 [Pandoraea sputorum]